MDWTELQAAAEYWAHWEEMQLEGTLHDAHVECYYDMWLSK
jgi:hypothetical protein